MTIIRSAARPDDEEGILAVVAAAFSDPTRDGSEEIAIVRATWAAKNPDELVEMVAVEDDGTVVAHALAAAGRVDGVPTSVAGVAPVCVAPTHQQQRVGTALMRTLVETARARQWPLLVVLGDPAYYGRFGFEPAGPDGLYYAPVGKDDPHFQALVLDASAPTPRGEFSYCWEPVEAWG